MEPGLGAGWPPRRALEQLIEAVGVSHGDARLSVGAGIGLAQLVPGATPAQMIDAADQVMYACKKEWPAG